MKRVLKVVGVLFGLLLVFLFVSLRPDPLPTENAQPIDFEALRALAGTEELPVKINVLKVGDGAFPRPVVVGGHDFAMGAMSFFSYQIMLPDGHFGIVDTALDAEGVKGMGGSVDAAPYAAMQAAMLQAQFIVVTHEHFDHIGGIARAPNLDAIAKATLLTPEQLSSRFIADAHFAAGALEKFKPLTYDKLFKVAPGVVLLKAAGHTPGSQIVYVRLAEGKEVLLVGDIAWWEENLRTAVSRPFLVSALMLREDRPALKAQQRALIEASKDPNVTVVVGHDPPQIERLIGQGVLKRGFDAPEVK
jgi:glyoxylase-like metal-dependent hydrolase (beta-lactamase superfamily II)